MPDRTFPSPIYGLLSVAFLLAGFAPGFITDARAQSTVSGYVSDDASGETLLLANVVIAGTTQGTATNNAGYYVLTGLEAGTYTLIASFIGYRSVPQTVTLADGESLRLDFRLPAEDFIADEVVVSADRTDEDERVQLGVSRMPTRLVTQLPAVFEADLFRSLQMLPGIKAANDYSSGLYIRGGSPDQTLILLDRTTVYNPSHFFGLFSTFNPDAIKDVQVFKGSYPVRYGGRLGSVLDVYNKDGNRERMHGKVALGLLASRLSLEGPHRKGSWMLAVRRSTLEPLLAALRKSEDAVPEVFYFYDVNGKINVDVGPNDRFSLAVYGGTDQLRMSPLEDFDIDLPYGNRTGSLTWTHLYSNTLFTSLTFTGSKYFSLPELRFAGTRFERRNEVYDVSLKADLEYLPGPRHALEAGFWAGNLLLNFYDRNDGLVTFRERTETLYGSAYAQEAWRPSDRLTVTAGVRLNTFAAGHYVRLAPRVSVEYLPHPRLRLQAAYGRYHQFLSLITNEAFSGLDVWLATDEAVPPAWGDQFGLGMKAIVSEGYRFDAEVYTRTMEDLFELNPSLPEVSGLEYADLFRFGNGYAYGAEFMLEKTDGDLTGFVGYTYGRSRRRFDGANGGRYYAPKYDRTHDVTVVLNYDLNRSTRLTGAFVFATGQAYTRALGRTQYDDPFTSGASDQIIIGEVNGARLPTYHRLDIGVTRRGRFFRIADYELQVQAINAYNRRNIWFYQYDFEENPVARDPVQMLPILPNLSFTVSF